MRMKEDEHKAVRELVEKIEHPHEEEEEKKKSPFKYIVALFLIVIVAMWIIPIYGVKLDPQPEEIPTVEEVIPETLTYGSLVTLSLKEHVIIDSEIKGIADRIVTTACSSSSEVCYAKALFYFVRDNFEYLLDPRAIEYVEDPKEFLAIGGGDCESGSILLASMMESIGIDTQLVLIKGHAYARIYLPESKKGYQRDGWVYLDWTCKSCDFGELPYSDFEPVLQYLEVP